jgi:hypothetical protein
MSDSPDTPAANDNDIPAFAVLAADPEIAPLLDFEPVPRKVKRPDGWTPELQRELIARLAHTGTLQEAVWQMGKHATGAEGLYKTACADSFRAAWDAALALGRHRNGLDSQPPYTGEVPGIARRKSSRREAPPPFKRENWGEGQVLNEFGEWEDEESLHRRADEARDGMARKLLNARRLYLQEISHSPGKRAAFEILTELPIDWERAALLQPQADEPWRYPNQRQPDMILTAESGWSWGERGYGPDRLAELHRALDEARAEMGLPPIMSAESKTNDGEADASA